jgi:arylformamidase
MLIHDISLTISNDTLVWPGDTPVNLERNKDMLAGDSYNLSRISGTVHMGTHIDAPMHFLRDGYGVDRIDPEMLVGPCYVADLTGADVIDAQCLERAGIPGNTRRLLCRTRNSEFWARGDNVFHKDYTGISDSGAEWIVKHKIRLIGLDYLSISEYKNSVAVHETLLSHGIIPLEGVDLSKVGQGEYQLICLPLKLKDCDGSPVRAVLVQDE